MGFLVVYPVFKKNYKLARKGWLKVVQIFTGHPLRCELSCNQKATQEDLLLGFVFWGFILFSPCALASVSSLEVPEAANFWNAPRINKWMRQCFWKIYLTDINIFAMVTCVFYWYDPFDEVVVNAYVGTHILYSSSHFRKRDVFKVKKQIFE